MFTHPYIAKLADTQRYERMLRDADEWRLARKLRKTRSSTPMRDAYRALCGLARHIVDWARGWQPTRLIEQH